MAGKTIRVETLQNGYKRCMPFNRYCVEKVDDFTVMHFGLISPSGNLMDYYVCAISKIELESQSKSLLDYLGKLGTLGAAPAQWQPPTTQTRIDLCNHLGLCGNPELGELTLNNMVGKDLAELRTGQTVIKADTMALLRSSLEIQKHWLKDVLK